MAKKTAPTPAPAPEQEPAALEMDEAGLLFELFYRKTAPLHAVSIEMTGFSKCYDRDILLKNGKSDHRKIYSGSYARHGFLINPVSLLFHTTLQILPELCMPRSGGDEHDCKSEYMHLHFF